MRFCKCVYLMGPKFSVVKRAEWGAVEPKEVIPLKLPVKTVVIHHTCASQCTSKRTCMQELRKLQEKHMKEKGHADIKWNFLIGGDGKVYEGRGWHVQGEHVKDYDDETIGVAFMGDFCDVDLDPEMAESFRGLVYYGVRFGYLQEGHELETVLHTDLDFTTYCPGYYTMDMWFDETVLTANEHWTKRNVVGKLWDKLVGFEIG